MSQHETNFPAYPENWQQPAALVLDQSHNYFTDVVTWLPRYELHDDVFFVDDPVWGKEIIGGQAGDEVLIELAHHSALQRLQNVEQLTLPRDYTTVPNTALFTRWEHIWGSVVLTRQLARNHGLSDQESLTMQLRTLLSDVGHTTGSHLGDWLFQGVGGDENQHDLELETYLEVSGVNATLRKHGINPKAVTPETSDDWIEAPSPKLCIDRVDYGMREIRRWVPTELGPHDISAGDFVIVDGALVMHDPAKAEAFGEAYLELGREHWYEPAHRLVLQLYINRAKRVLTDEHGYSDDWQTYHPRDVLYCSDEDYALAMLEHDPYGHAVDTLMRDISQYERKMGWLKRRERVARRLKHHHDYGIGSIYHDYADHHPMLVIEAEGTAPISADRHLLDFSLPALKVRQIDPVVIVGGRTVPLSTVNEAYAESLRTHRRQISQAYAARIAIGDPSLRQRFKETERDVDQTWLTLLRRPRMPKSKLIELIASSAMSESPYGIRGDF